MDVQKSTGNFLSSNEVTDITYYIYEPVGEPVAMLQISHGMCEYLERYEPVIEFLVGNGYLVFGNDHLGHKNSVLNKSELGYMAYKDGWKCLYKDVITLGRKMQVAYPSLPLFLFGHSMGSFVARAALVNAPDLFKGVILCGTGGTNSMIGIGKKVISLVRKLKGDHYRSKMLNNLMFGHYNKRYTEVRTRMDWLSQDKTIVDNYLGDEYCTFIFTASGFYDLACILQYVSSEEWYERIPQELPIYVISGEMDPVGEWGVGIKEVDQRLKKIELKDYRMKLYPQMRHELLNEVGREEVYKDILNWLKEH
ncbi:MAG: alpha/beta hydrolase [Lachnospiraceae bacterium]